MKRLIVIAVLAACGSRQPPPAKPQGPDPKRIAAQLHLDLRQLGEIAARLKGNCPQLVVELRPHIDRMKVHADEARSLQKDPELGKRLKTEVMAYDEQDRGVSESIGDDLATTYQTCADKPALRAVIDGIPSF